MAAAFDFFYRRSPPRGTGFVLSALTLILMITIKYDFRRSHPRLFARCVTPVEEIPVFYNAKVQCLASMNDAGQFFMTIPKSLGLRVTNNDAFIEAEWTDAYPTAPEDPPGPVKLLSLRIVDVPFLY